MEHAIISAVTHDASEAKITVTGLPDTPGVAARIFRTMADEDVNVDMIVQNVGAEGVTDISFTLPFADVDRSMAVLRPLCDEMGGTHEITADQSIGRVSVVGAGMKTNPGVAAKMFETLSANGINIEMISTSAIRISCVVRQERLEDAVVVLHEAFELGRPIS